MEDVTVYLEKEDIRLVGNKYSLKGRINGIAKEISYSTKEQAIKMGKLYAQYCKGELFKVIWNKNGKEIWVSTKQEKSTRYYLHTKGR